MAFLIHHLLSESAARFPDRKAVLFKDESATYAALESDSNRLARVLLGAGVRRGDRVGIYMPRSISSVVAAYGVLKTGAAYVPIDPLAPENRLGAIVAKCGVETMVCSREKVPVLEKVFDREAPLKRILSMTPPATGSGAPAKFPVLSWEELRGGAGDQPPGVHAIDADLSYVLFTSGSTGVPKGVMISHLNSLTFVNMAADFFRISPDDVLSNISPLHFDLSVFDFFAAARAGASVRIVPEEFNVFPTKLAGFIAGSRITVWNSVPSSLTLLANFAELDKHDLSALRLVLFAGEVIPVKHLRKLKAAMPAAAFYNVYGQTEANSSTYYRVDEVPADDSAAIPIGKPFPNFDVFAVDESGKPVRSPGEKGELYVRAATVAAGYWGEPEKTREKFVPNPLPGQTRETVYRTGDIVRLDDEGNYVFSGRVDHMIKTRGYRVEIGEIETIVSGHPRVKRAVVVPIPDELIGNRISVVAEVPEGGGLAKEEFLAYCHARLPKYMVPEIVEFRDSLPETSSGKADRKRLAEMMMKIVFPDRT